MHAFFNIINLFIPAEIYGYTKFTLEGNANANCLNFIVQKLLFGY